MTDTTEQTQTPPVVEAKPRERAKAEKGFYATLVRGARYVVLHEGKLFRFEKGKPSKKPIPADLKAHLERNAVDTVTVGTGDEDDSVVNENRSKFTFEPA